MRNHFPTLKFNTSFLRMCKFSFIFYEPTNNKRGTYNEEQIKNRKNKLEIQECPSMLISYKTHSLSK